MGSLSQPLPPSRNMLLVVVVDMFSAVDVAVVMVVVVAVDVVAELASRSLPLRQGKTAHAATAQHPR